MKRVLLLDDNPDTLELAETVLAYENFEVKTAEKIAGFIETAKEFAPDLMIIDYRLEDGNGGELCQTIKHDDTLKHIPVILFTADTDARLQLLDYDADAIIAKPFDLLNFLTTVRKLTNKG